MSTREWLDQVTSLCKHGQLGPPINHDRSYLDTAFLQVGSGYIKELVVFSTTDSPLPKNHPSSLPHNRFTMCHYQPIIVECPACRNVVSRGGEDRECRDYIKTRDREMGRMHRWREGSRERAPPTPFIFGWCRKYGKTERDPVIVVSEKACDSCPDARWNDHPSPSDSEASTSFVRDGWLSPDVQTPLTPLTSIEDELDSDKMELDFPTLDAPGKWTHLGTHA